MGSSVSPIVANLFMEDFETRAIQSAQVRPMFWGQYVDDALVIINTADIDTFTTHLNQVHPREVCCTRREDGSLDFSVYRKPTQTDQYLAFDSKQTLQHKLGMVCTLKHRARTINKDRENLGKNLQHITQSLSICGYMDRATNSELRQKKQQNSRGLIERLMYAGSNKSASDELGSSDVDQVRHHLKTHRLYCE